MLVQTSRDMDQNVHMLTGAVEVDLDKGLARIGPIRVRKHGEDAPVTI